MRMNRPGSATVVLSLLLAGVGCDVFVRRPPRSRRYQGEMPRDGQPEVPVAPDPVAVAPGLAGPTGDGAVVREGDLADIYHLRPGDAVEITVLEEPELSRRVIVRPDGRISYPFVGEIVAGGRTVAEVEQTVVEGLRAYIREPVVTVAAVGFAGNVISIIGAVNGPGPKPFTGDIRVLDAIALAGGLQTQLQAGQSGGSASQGVAGVANLREAYLVRGNTLVPVDFEALIVGRELSENIRIYAGDLIYIPSSVENRVYVLGEVNQQRSIQFGSRITLLAALTEAGGLDVVTSDRRHVYILRGGIGAKEVTEVDVGRILTGMLPDLELRSSDIVYVPPTQLVHLERIASRVIPLLHTVIQTEAARRAAREF